MSAYDPKADIAAVDTYGSLWPPLRPVRGILAHMTASFRNIVLGLCCIVACAVSAQAHPHVWVTMRTELVYTPDGRITGVRHAWAFDDMFSTFAIQGLESKEKGKFTRDELAPLAKVNVESLKEFDYFTYATVDGKKAALTDPLSDYWFDYTNSVLTLHFTLPFKSPVKAKELKVEIYDPTIFVDFAFAKQSPVKLVGAPKCKLEFALPRQMTSAQSKALSQIPADPFSTTTAGEAQFANKILVHCP
jgi:ABC-type uncharacterized transport system substrate-binding protein